MKSGYEREKSAKKRKSKRGWPLLKKSRHIHIETISITIFTNL